ncbi:MAG: YfdX family protein [Flavobacteriaceae bacterium]|nr:YfdX family protein [Flavobacteriaceae bacterium]
MKNTIKSLVLLSAIVIGFTACQSKVKKTDNETSKKTEVIAEKPANLEMSEDSILIKVQIKAMDKIRKAKEKIVNEAIQAVIETQNTVQLLSNNKADDATKQLEKIIGEIEIITARYPKLELLPIDVNVSTNDLITDISKVKQITKDAEKALKNERLQEARALLSGLASEINITTVNIPLATYPFAIKDAVKLIDEGKLDEAKSVLIATLNELVIEEDILPIPILQAEVLIDEAMVSHLENRKENKAIVINLLDNAEYQLKLAEVLGYGEKNKMYKELNNDIKSLKKSANSDADLKELLNKLKLKLKNFREKLF